MRNRWLALSLSAVVGLAGCGGGSHHAHKPHFSSWSTTKPKVTASAPTTVTGGLQTAGGSVHPPGWGLPPKGATRPSVVRPGTVATAIQYDSIELSTVPRGARYLAGYTSGFWPTWHAMVILPWHPHVISIAISASHHAQCLDIEPGDAVPAQAASWYAAVKSDPGMRGSLVDGKPCEYSSYWEFVNQVWPVLRAHGIGWNDLWKWDANFTFHVHLDSGFNCTQFTDKANGVNLDASLCTLGFLGVHPKPPPPPPPHYPYPVKLMTASENAVLKSYYGAHCAGKRTGPCPNDRYRAHYLSHNIWVAKARDHKPWGFRNRGVRFHVLTIIENR